MTGPRATGGCLCGAVRYEVRGPLRDVMLCHCRECRRWSGHAGTFAATRLEHFVLVEERGLRWFDSPQSDCGAERGFCTECGSALFWRPRTGIPRVSISAGSLDEPTGLTTAGHWYTRQAGDWYALPDDGLPRDDPAAAAIPS
ncbi:MAG: GFA family protein [Gaiella sp.]